MRTEPSFSNAAAFACASHAARPAPTKYRSA